MRAMVMMHDDDYNKQETKKMSSKDREAYGDYAGKMKAEEDLRTLVMAREVKADKKRFKAAMHCAKEKRAKLNKVVTEGNDG